MSKNGRVEHRKYLRVLLDDGRVMCHEFSPPALKSRQLENGDVLTEVTTKVKSWIEPPPTGHE